MDDNRIINEILTSREERAELQKKIISTYNNPIISFTLNIPGAIKDSPQYRSIHNIGMETRRDKLKESNYNIIYFENINKSTGPEGYFSVEILSNDLKTITTKIENEHILGRIFDIDVFDKDNSQISRSDLGLSPRKCLVCEKNAKICSRAQTHELKDLLDEIEKIYAQYLIKDIQR